METSRQDDAMEQRREEGQRAYARNQYYRDQAADDNREAFIEKHTKPVTAANFPAGKPRVSSHDFTDFGLEQTYHRSSNTIEHAPDGYAHGDDCQYKIIETWYADEFERATLYVLAHDRWADIMQTDNLEAIYLVLVNIWTFDKRFSKRHYKQHPEAAEQAEADSLIPY